MRGRVVLVVACRCLVTLTAPGWFAWEQRPENYIGIACGVLALGASAYGALCSLAAIAALLLTPWAEAGHRGDSRCARWARAWRGRCLRTLGVAALLGVVGAPLATAAPAPASASASASAQVTVSSGVSGMAGPRAAAGSVDASRATRVGADGAAADVSRPAAAAAAASADPGPRPDWPTAPPETTGPPPSQISPAPAASASPATPDVSDVSDASATPGSTAAPRSDTPLAPDAWQSRTPVPPAEPRSPAATPHGSADSTRERPAPGSSSPSGANVSSPAQRPASATTPPALRDKAPVRDSARRGATGYTAPAVPHTLPRALGGGAGAREVIVREGDSLWSIAAQHLGAGASDREIAKEWPRWYRLNAEVVGPDPDRLLIGTRLFAPD